MLLINPYRFVTSSRIISIDADVNSYLNLVEAADGQELESGVITAVENFVLGCKADGIWSAIKASCILAGARTLAGALTPLVGAAPTNVNFVSGDYNRKTGLIGNGSNKRISTNRNNNVDPQNSRQMSVYVTTANSGTAKAYIGSGDGPTGSFSFGRSGSRPADLYSYNANSAFQYILSRGAATGFLGTNRSSSASYNFRAAASTTSQNTTSQTPFNGTQTVFSVGTALHSNARMSFYAFGESLDLALLDTRVSNLMTALAAAIP
jgi:hypothetical protein